MDRAYSIIEIKSFDEEKREFSGIATTITPDRVHDIVEPLGAIFKLPIPLFSKHDSKKPIGEVFWAKVTATQIEYKARIPVVSEQGLLRDRVDEAWQEIKYKLVRGVSIGFKPIDGMVEFLKSGGIRFKEWEWLELSPVSIPMNSEANIQSVKSFDRQQRAASGQSLLPVVRLHTSAGVSATIIKSIPMTPPEGSDMNIQEQIKSYQATRAAKAARIEEIMEKSATEGLTLDAQQSEEYDTIDSEIKSIDAHLKRLESMEVLNMQKAKPIVISATQTEVKQYGNAVPKAAPLRDGIAMAQVVKFLGRAQGNRYEALEIAKSTVGVDSRVVAVLKAAVAAGSTGNAGWAGNLVGEETSVYADFIEYLRPQTIVGRFGSGGIPSLRLVPFRVPLIGQTSGGSGYWTGEGKPKPLTKFDFTRTTIEPLKVANIAVVTEEVLRDSSPAADAIIRDQLVAALRERLDIDFIDPAKAASAGISPASITNGITAIASSGNDAEAVRADIKALFGNFIAGNNAPTNGVWGMSATTALSLSLMQNPLGQAEFPGISMTGGTLFGLPAIVSEYFPTDSDGGLVVLINASDIYLADEGGFAVDISREASLQMLDNPTNDTTTPTATSLVSLWQTNSVGFRAERTINWARRRAASVAVLTGVNWGDEAA
jgi:HK97 family phage major capsid protein